MMGQNVGLKATKTEYQSENDIQLKMEDGARNKEPLVNELAQIKFKASFLFHPSQDVFFFGSKNMNKLEGKVVASLKSFTSISVI